MRNIFLVVFVCFVSFSVIAQPNDVENAFLYETSKQELQDLPLMNKQQLAELVVDKSKMMDALSVIIKSMRENSTDLVFNESVMEIDKELYLRNASQILSSQFSEAELRALLNFYSSEEGASIAKKMPYFQAVMGKILENMIVKSSKKLSLE